MPTHRLRPFAKALQASLGPFLPAPIDAGSLRTVSGLITGHQVPGLQQMKESIML